MRSLVFYFENAGQLRYFMRGELSQTEACKGTCEIHLPYSFVSSLSVQQEQDSDIRRTLVLHGLPIYLREE